LTHIVFKSRSDSLKAEQCLCAITSFQPPTCCLTPPRGISLFLSRLVYKWFITFQQMFEMIPTNILPMNPHAEKSTDTNMA